MTNSSQLALVAQIIIPLISFLFPPQEKMTYY